MMTGFNVNALPAEINTLSPSLPPSLPHSDSLYVLSQSENPRGRYEQFHSLFSACKTADGVIQINYASAE
jgi:hypothetical protein